MPLATSGSRDPEKNKRAAPLGRPESRTAAGGWCGYLLPLAIGSLPGGRPVVIGKNSGFGSVVLLASSNTERPEQLLRPPESLLQLFSGRLVIGYPPFNVKNRE